MDSEIERLKKNNLVLFIIILMLLSSIVLLMFIVVSQIGSEGDKCLRNPLVYGANQLQKVNADEIYCQCNIVSKYPSPTLMFNKNMSWFRGNEIGSGQLSISIFNESVLERLFVE